MGEWEMNEISRSSKLISVTMKINTKSKLQIEKAKVQIYPQQWDNYTREHTSARVLKYFTKIYSKKCTSYKHSIDTLNTFAY